MLARFISISTTIAQTIKTLLIATAKYLIGDGFYETVEIKAGKNTEGIGIVRFGPPILAANLCLIQPSCEPRIVYDQLKQLMSLENIDSRHLYACVNFLTGSDFFISMHGAAARESRKNLVRHLDLNKLYALSISQVEKALHEIELKNTYAVKNSYGRFERDIKENIFRLFAHGLCGFALDSDFSKITRLLDQLEAIPVNTTLFYVFFTQLAQRFHPAIRKMREEFDGIITQFIKEQIKSLQQDDAEIKKNILCSRINIMYPERPLHELSVEDIACITKDRQIRTTISGLIAINNITKLILAAIRQFELTRENIFYTQLVKEIYLSSGDKKCFMHKDKMPLLHAFYLEMLRHQPPMPSLGRYTKKSIQIGSQKIPANSLIIFDLKTALLKCGGEAYNPRGFYPERYLNNKGALNALAKDSQQVLLPFGAGARMCPAVTVAEMVFKTYLIAIFQDAHKKGLIAEPIADKQVSVEKEQQNVATLTSCSLGL